MYYNEKACLHWRHAFIDASLTQQPGWSGDWVYQAGGCALIYGQTNSSSRINTPMGDYSGDITVTAKVRAFPSDYLTAELNIIPVVGGLENPSYAKTDDPSKMYAFRLRDEEGWVEIEYTYRNYQADADGFIMFSATGAIEFDWIKVVVNPIDFLAEPKINPITNVTNESMTLNWDPVDRAFSYHIWLWKVNYLADGDVEYTEDFEGANPLSGSEWTYDLSANSGIQEGEGSDNSRGLKLYNGDAITAPEYIAKFYNFTCWLKAQDDTNAKIYFDFKTGDTWKEYGYLPLYYFTYGDALDMDYEMWGDFKLQYDGIRVRFEDLADDEYVIIDDLYAKTTRPGELELQCLWPEFADEPDLQDYWYADVTGQGKVCQYELTDLDPLGDYYYRIDSKRIYLYSESTMQHALVIASPELEEASDIDSRGSYTANWAPVAKAESYTVYNYGAIVAAEDGFLTLLEEDFSKITADCGSSDPYSPVDLSNYWGDENLDAYTMLPGWSGAGNSISASCMGVVEAFFVESYLATPVLYLDNNTWTRITLKAYGQPDGNFTLKYGDLAISLTFDANGVIEGYLDLNITGKDNSLRFYANDYGAFMIDYLKVEQEVKAGAAAITYLSSVDTDAETGSYTFENLDETGFDQFAFTVVAHMTAEGKTISSAIESYMVVDLENGTSGAMSSIETIESAEAVAPATEIARYSINGTQVDEHYRGMVIIRYSDGTARKLMQR